VRLATVNEVSPNLNPNLDLNHGNTTR
jgi:hypothetical protein